MAARKSGGYDDKSQLTTKTKYIMKTELTQMDKWALESARGLDNTKFHRDGHLPTVERYNQAVNAGALAGNFIVPLGERKRGE